MKKIIGLLSIFGLALSAVQGDVITGLTADAEIYSTVAGDNSTTGYLKNATETLQIGRASKKNTAAVLVFQLSDLGDGNSFENVVLEFTLTSVAATYDIDLYGLDARNASAVAQDDFYMSTSTDSSSDATLLQEGILTGDSTAGTITSVDITSWLNEQYEDENRTGDYVFLRLSAGVGSSLYNANNGYYISSADATSGQPTLSYTVVPEPATLGMIGIGALIAMVVRRWQHV